MTASNSNVNPVLIAIDIAKRSHDVLIQLPERKPKYLKIPNSLKVYQQILSFIPSEQPVDRKYLNYCGFSLSASQSGQGSSKHKLSKRGNSRLRYAFWLAATIAIKSKENSFAYKYNKMIAKDPLNKDLQRKARTAIAIKMARVVHSLIKQNLPYQGYHETSYGT